MNYLLRDMQSTDVFKSIISKKENSEFSISGLNDVSKSVLLSAYANESKKPILLITYNELQLKKIVNDLKYFGNDVLTFPKRELSIYDYDVESNEIEHERIDVLNKIVDGKTKFVVTTIEAVMQPILKKEKLYENKLSIDQTDTLDLEELKEKLILLDYERADLVEYRGQFSIRGDIVDVALNDNEGVRIELWGDEIDSIRLFKLSSQRSTKNIDKITIYPNTEKILDGKIENITKKILAKYSKVNDEQKKIIDEDIEAISNGNYKSKIDKYFDEFYEDKSTLLDYVKDFRIFIDEPSKLEEREKSLIEENKNLSKEIIEKNKIVPEIILDICNFKLKIDNEINLLEQDTKENNFKLREINIYEGDLKALEFEVNNSIEHGKKVVVLAGTKENRDKISKMFPTAVKTDEIDNLMLKDKQIVISIGALSSGYENRETGLVVISSEDFFVSKNVAKRKSNEKFNSAEQIVFADLKVNDYIVHKNYGIGIYTGIKTITTDGVTKDYIAIKYRDGDTLYVPTNDLDNVRKYIGEEDTIRLNKLGTKEWSETKAKVKGNLRTVAKELIELYAKRENAKGYAFSKDTPWQREFEDDFPYQETDDQLKCIAEVKKDMESDKPMDRLLCGDVGYGKTEVALRAAFKAVMDGKQVAYLAPTTILANQQYEEFKDRMKSYPITIELLNRFRTKKEQNDVVKNLNDGKVDIVVGTHRLLSKDVKFKNLGLLIIDEEHRFGVKAKEKIKEYKTNVDVLTMTATPIPRTLQMSIVGIRDMSVIYEPPHNRKPIQTYVLEYDKEIVKEAITKELERGGQVYYIFNNVQGIDLKAQEIRDLVPEAKVDFAHGKMSGEEIENIMQNFIDKKINVLVCTTILESGIDIPNANTIIVENADRFGLAQLYQIRGRVGRSSRQAYAYITYRKDKMISEDANQRLKAIKEFTEFGSGFKIATRDLQIRGAGSIFGEVQSGHMGQVGYDMYVNLLNEVVKETKGEKVEPEKEDVTIDINISSYIPDNYIESQPQKIEIYQDIANCKNEDDIKNVIDEIIDRYGDMPKDVINLIEVARIKNLCKEKNVTKVQEKFGEISFTINHIENVDINKLWDIYKNNIRFHKETPVISIRVNDAKKLEEIKKFLKVL